MAKISDDTHKELRLILDEQYVRNITPEDVKEIGDGLVDFYFALVELCNGRQEPKDQ